MSFSIIIATHCRAAFLKECIFSLFNQTLKDFEVIIAHSGADQETRDLIEQLKPEWQNRLIYLESVEKGAAPQRNEGIRVAGEEWVVFLDDDIIAEPEFIFELNKAKSENPEAKGISGRISNQYFETPGRFTQLILKICGVKPSDKMDGNVIGPAINFLPKKEGAKYEKISWMPTCISAYEKKWLLDCGGFPKKFTAYSFGEDLYLSYKLSRDYPIVLNRDAILYHNDMGGRSHTDIKALAKMEISNKAFIIKELISPKLKFILQLFLWYCYNAFRTNEPTKNKIDRILAYMSFFINYIKR